MPVPPTLLVCLVVALFVGAPLLQSAASADTTAAHSERRLRLYHTGERIDIAYRVDGRYIPEAAAKLDYLLRDHRTGDVRHCDSGLYDLLWDLTAALEQPEAEIEIICGYRPPKRMSICAPAPRGSPNTACTSTPRRLTSASPGIETITLRNAALALHRGGGFYPRSAFVHVDTGRVTQWCFGCVRPQTTHQNSLNNSKTTPLV